MTVTAEHRARLTALRERAKTARASRARARQTLEAAEQAGDRDAAAVASMALDSAQIEVETSDQLESMLLAQVSGLSSDAFVPGILDDPQAIATLERLGNGTFPVGAIDLGPLSSREQLVQRINTGNWGQPKLAANGNGDGNGLGGDVTVPDSARLGAYYGIVPQPRRPLSLLDLVPTSPMDGRSFGYMQEGGDLDTAREVSEGEVKPPGDLSLDEAEVVAKTVAVWQKMLRQQLADVTTLAQVVNARLTYAVLRRLENQIVAGDGTGENMLGILNTDGVQSIDFDAGVPLSDLPLDAITDVLLADAVADAVVLHPRDLASMLKATDEGGGRLDSGGAFALPVPSVLWGLPTVTSTVMPQGQALVGAFGTACRLFIREAINVRISDADQDDFLRNRVTALAELRAGLGVWQPSAFCIVSLGAAAAGAVKAGPAKAAKS